MRSFASVADRDAFSGTNWSLERRRLFPGAAPDQILRVGFDSDISDKRHEAQPSRRTKMELSDFPGLWAAAWEWGVACGVTRPLACKRGGPLSALYGLKPALPQTSERH
jgi:hypothetical protein